MILDFYKTTINDIEIGNFPLNHDCILIAYYFHGCGINRDYFSCRAEQSSALVDILCKLSIISRVKIVSVDEFSC